MTSSEQQGAALQLLLKQIALQKGLTNQMIADRIGWTQGNVNRILNAKYSPTLANFLELAKAIEVNFFFEDKDGTTELTVAFEAAMDELGRRKPKNLN